MVAGWPLLFSVHFKPSQIKFGPQPAGGGWAPFPAPPLAGHSIAVTRNVPSAHLMVGV